MRGDQGSCDGGCGESGDGGQLEVAAGGWLLELYLLLLKIALNH